MEEYYFLINVDIYIKFVFKEVFFIYLDRGDLVLCIFNLIVIFYLNNFELFDGDIWKKFLVSKGLKGVMLNDVECMFIVFFSRDVLFDIVGISIFISGVFFLDSSSDDFEVFRYYYVVEGVFMNLVYIIFLEIGEDMKVY